MRTKQQLISEPGLPKIKYVPKHKKEPKRNKSGLLSQLYSNLSDEEKTAVKTAMVAYNNMYGDRAFYEPEQFYQMIYKRIPAFRGQ